MLAVCVNSGARGFKFFLWVNGCGSVPSPS
jgi:hypothetical protein